MLSTKRGANVLTGVIILFAAALAASAFWTVIRPIVYPGATQLAINNGFAAEGFDGWELENGARSQVVWVVKHPDGWCHYELLRELPQLPGQDAVLFFKLTTKESWWQGDGGQAASLLDPPPPLRNPTPETAWELAQKWGNPPPHCDPKYYKER